MSDASTETTAIAEYSQTEAALSELRTRFTGIKFDVSTTKGIDEAKKARAEIKKYRVALEDKRKEIKEPALRHCQLIDAEAKRITEELRKLEDPIDKQIKDEEARKEAEKQAKVKAERERVAAIQSRINSISQYPVEAVSMSSEDIKELIGTVEQINIDDSFAEFKDRAEVERTAAVAKLKEMITAKQQQEAQAEENRKTKEALEAEEKRLEGERAELERKQEQVNVAVAALPSVALPAVAVPAATPEPAPEPVPVPQVELHPHHIQAINSIHALASDANLSDSDARKKILSITKLFV